MQSTPFFRFALFAGLCLTLASCAATPAVTALGVQQGVASYYSIDFQGRRTSSGEVFDNSKMTAAHRTYPFGTLVLVTNLKNNKSVEVRINDRGPHKSDRIIDLSLAAAEQLGMLRDGLARVRVEIVRLGAENDSGGQY